MKRLFGTDGIRAVAGEFPLDTGTVRRIGRALVHSLEQEAGRPPHVVIGRDTRVSGPDIERALVQGIEEAGGRVDRGGVLTTPAVACVVRLLAYDAGIVVSASHNPYRDNGIKVFSGRGTKLSDGMEVEIERLVLDEGLPQARSRPSGRDRSARPAVELQSRYIEWLRGCLPDAVTFAGWKIVLDCANGAASSLGPALFETVGAEVSTLHAAPDGRNINRDCGALYPGALAAEVARSGARLGLAFDGDADRCLLVDSSGRVLDGDYLLFLLATDLKRAGKLAKDTVVATVMSNLWLETALTAEGVRTVRAPVGDKYVLETMVEGGYILGGEQSGHIIFLEWATTGDGLLTGLRVMDLLRRTGLDLASWAGTIRPCPQILLNVAVSDRPPLDTHARIGPAIRDEEERLGASGRILVRYSGTEPKARIMVEGPTRTAVEACARRLESVIRDEIGREPSGHDARGLPHK